MCAAPLEMNEGTLSGKKEYNMPQGSSAVRPTNGLYLYILPFTADVIKKPEVYRLFKGLWFINKGDKSQRFCY